MSRTYRRIGNSSERSWNSKADACSEWVCRDLSETYHNYELKPLQKNTVEYKRKAARYHSDAGTTNFKEPGPSWFRNLFCERSQRRDAKQQLKKYMFNEDYEVCLMAKNHLPYWT